MYLTYVVTMPGGRVLGIIKTLPMSNRALKRDTMYSRSWVQDGLLVRV